MSIDPMQRPSLPSSAEPTATDAGQQLEAFFLRRMLAEMRASVGEGMLSGGYAGKMFQEMLDEAMAEDISTTGGLGIAELVTRELEPTTRSNVAMGKFAQAYQPAGGDLRNVPVTARMSSDFGARVHPVTGAKSFHEGVDLAAAKGSDVAASGAGVVVRAADAGSYGNIVVVDHGGGLETRYAHLDSMSVKVGQQVAAGDIVGYVGETGRVTGPHLHFEVRRDGRPINPNSEILDLQKDHKGTKE